MDILDQVRCYAWIHCLISTKDENPTIQPHFKEELNQIIEESFLNMGSPVGIINSSATHVNCLFNLNPNKSVQQVIDKIKVIASNFINSKLETQGQTIWEEDFSCISVDSTNYEEVFNFIRDQELRNLREPNTSEFSKLLELHKVAV